MMLGCTPSETPSVDTDAGGPLCNGSAEACDARMDQWMVPKSHNSFASEDRGFVRGASNHLYDIPAQLDAGIRWLNLDVYDPGGPLVSCHSVCGWGELDLLGILKEIDDYLQAHPRTFIFLDFQAYIDEAKLVDTLIASGLPERAMVRDPDAAWPTYGELLDDGRQIFVLWRDVEGHPWMHDKDRYVTTTNYYYTSLDDYDCAIRNQAGDGSLFEIAHLLYKPFAHPEAAMTANTREVLEDRIAMCVEAEGATVNAIEVDFHSIGDLIEVVADANARR
jgi:hypothetical protein